MGPGQSDSATTLRRITRLLDDRGSLRCCVDLRHNHSIGAEIESPLNRNTCSRWDANQGRRAGADCLQNREQLASFKRAVLAIDKEPVKATRRQEFCYGG